MLLAPDFALRDQNNQVVRLADFRGTRSVLLVFYPFAFTGTCQSELGSVRDGADLLADAGVQVLTISVDTVYAHKVWAEREGYEFPLLSDFWPHGKVSKAYGAFDDSLGAAGRATYLIDQGGTIRWSVQSAIADARDINEYLKALENL